jgi:hypothetical protein
VVLEQCEKKAAVLGVGEWFVPGGKIDGDESEIACCQREMREEWPGVEVLTMDPLPIVEGSAVPPGPRGVVSDAAIRGHGARRRAVALGRWCAAAMGADRRSIGVARATSPHDGRRCPLPVRGTRQHDVPRAPGRVRAVSEQTVRSLRSRSCAVAAGGRQAVTILTNRAILVVAQAVVVTCGACRMRATPHRVVGIVEHWQDEADGLPHAFVAFHCSTPECVGSEGAGITVAIPL